MKKLKIGNKNPFGLKIPRKILSDSDKDGVPDPADCQPNNPNKQGRVGDWLRKKGGQYKEDRAKRQVANRQRKVVVQGARLEAREKAEVTLTKEREAYRGKRKLARYKQARPLQQRQQSRFGGKPPSMFGPRSGQPSMMNPFPKQEPSAKKKPKKRKKKKQSKKGKKRKKR